jgi:L-iditol 2-dehydrogenase
LKAGETVVVLGAGISGLLHIRLARTLGATKVMAVDISRYRIDFARKAGADLALHAESDVVKRLREMNGGFLADLVVVCTGASKAIQKAFECVDRGGTILFFAPTDQGVTLPLSINDVFWRRDVTLTTSYAGDRWDHLLALDLISSGRVQVKDMITHRLGLAETGVGFRLVEEAQESIKVVIEPQR